MFIRAKRLIHMSIENDLEPNGGLNRCPMKINPDEISDKKESQTIRILLHIIEELNEEVQALKVELQKTRDELNHLKGEQGKPKFSVPKQNKDVSLSLIHISEPTRLGMISYAVFCLKKK